MWVSVFGSKVIKGVLLDETKVGQYVEICTVCMGVYLAMHFFMLGDTELKLGMWVGP